MTYDVSTDAPERNEKAAQNQRLADLFVRRAAQQFTRLLAPEARGHMQRHPAAEVVALTRLLVAEYAPLTAEALFAWRSLDAAEQSRLIEEERKAIQAERKTPVRRRIAVQSILHKQKQAAEHVQLWLKLVGANASHVVSEPALQRHLTRRRKLMTWAKGQEAVSLSDPSRRRTLAEIIERHRAGRLAEKQFMFYLMQHVAAQGELEGYFITLTLEGQWHPNPSKGKNTWNGKSPSIGTKELNRRLKAARDLAKANLGYYPRFVGAQYREHHKDGLTHGHPFLQIHPEDAPVFLDAIQKYFPGHASKIEKHDPDRPEGAARFASYCIKYLLSGLEEYEADEEANQRKPGIRYAAARNIWRVRQTDSYGFRPGWLTDMREIAKAPERPDGIAGRVWDLLKTGDHGDRLTAARLLDAVPEWDIQRADEYAALGRSIQESLTRTDDLKTDLRGLSRRKEDKPRRDELHALLADEKNFRAALRAQRADIPKDERVPRRKASGWKNEYVRFNSVGDRPHRQPMRWAWEIVDRLREVEAALKDDGIDAATLAALREEWAELEARRDVLWWDAAFDSALPDPEREKELRSQAEDPMPHQLEQSRLDHIKAPDTDPAAGIRPLEVERRFMIQKVESSSEGATTAVVGNYPREAVSAGPSVRDLAETVDPATRQWLAPWIERHDAQEGRRLRLRIKARLRKAQRRAQQRRKAKTGAT